MTKARRERVIERSGDLLTICADMFKAAEIRLAILLDKLDGSSQLDQRDADGSAQTKRRVKALVLQWGACWETNMINPELKHRQDLDIPEEYFENWAQFEDESNLDEGGDIKSDDPDAEMESVKSESEEED